jgi:elongation factor G
LPNPTEVSNFAFDK